MKNWIKSWIPVCIFGLCAFILTANANAESLPMSLFLAKKLSTNECVLEQHGSSVVPNAYKKRGEMNQAMNSCSVKMTPEEFSRVFGFCSVSGFDLRSNQGFACAVTYGQPTAQSAGYVEFYSSAVKPLIPSCDFACTVK